MLVRKLDLGESLQRLERLNRQELGDLVAQCGEAIAKGSSCIEAYVAFVLAQKELARRFGVATSFENPLRFPYPAGRFEAEGEVDVGDEEADADRRVRASEGSER
jgi:hypothetical protein